MFSPRFIKVSRYSCSMTNCRLVGGVVTLWWMSWKCLKTTGTHLFLSDPVKPAVQRQAVGIWFLQTLTHSHTHTLSLSVVLATPEDQTILLDFVCWEEAAYVSQYKGFEKYCFSSLIVLAFPHSSTNKALNTGHAITTRPSKHIYHSTHTWQEHTDC